MGEHSVRTSFCHLGLVLLLAILSSAQTISPAPPTETVVTLGLIGSAATGIAFNSVFEPLIAAQVAIGVSAAVLEANEKAVLGNTTRLRVVVRDVAPIFGEGGPETFELFTKENATSIIMPSLYSSYAAQYVTGLLGAPAVGTVSPDPNSIYVPTASQMINFRFSFKEELWQMINIAVNSKLRCKRFGIFFYVEPGVMAVKDELHAQLINLGFNNISLANYTFGTTTNWPLQVDSILSNRPHCIFFLADSDSVQYFSGHVVNHTNFDANNTFFISTSFGNAPSFRTYMRGRTYIVQQLPPPSDGQYTINQRFQVALSRLQDQQTTTGKVFDPFSLGDSLANKLNRWTPTYYSLEAYLMTRFAIDVMKTSNGDYSWKGFLDTVYERKVFTIDDVLIGPFVRSCLGMLNQSGLPCFCNSGNKVMHSSVLNSDGEVVGLPTPAIDEGLEAATLPSLSIPLQLCHMPDGLIHAPTIIISVTDLSGQDLSPTVVTNVLSAQESFSLSLQLLQKTGITRFQGSFVALAVNSTSGLQRKVEWLLDRYQLAAFAGGYQQPGWPLNVSGVLSIAGYTDGVLQLSDPLVIDFRKENIGLEPVLADYVHSLVGKLSEDVAANAVSAGGSSKYSIRVMATSEAEAALAGKSLLTYQLLFTTSVQESWGQSGDRAGLTSELNRWVAGSGGATPLLVVVSQNRSYVDAVVRWAMTEAPLVRVYAATAEEVLEELIGSLSSSEKAAFVAGQRHNVAFASVFDNFWASRATQLAASGVVDLMTAFEQILPGAAALGRPLSRNIRTLRAFRTAVALSSAQDQIISTVSSAVMLNIWYERGTITAVDEPLGRFYSNPCPAAVIAQNAADRTCQCAKGPRRFYVHTLLDWMNATSKAQSNSSYVYQMTTCSVLYTPLPERPDSTRTILLASILGSAALLMIVGFGFFLPHGGGARDNRNAVTDSSKSFAIVFTDIQSSTSLWGKIPELMGPAVDAHHNIIRKLVRRYGGYEVKTIGDSFMLVFSSARAALEFSAELQEDFFSYSWGTSAIDEVYHLLELEGPLGVGDDDTYSGSPLMPEDRTSGSATPARRSRLPSMSTAPAPENPLHHFGRPSQSAPAAASCSCGAAESNGDRICVCHPDATEEAPPPPVRVDTAEDGETRRRSSTGLQMVSGPEVVVPVIPERRLSNGSQSEVIKNTMNEQYWRGLRVRVGIHYGRGDIKHDPVTLGYDYYGTVVNTAARVEGVANGGQVLLTDDAYEAVLAELGVKSFPSWLAVKKLGPQPLRGLPDPVVLYQILPAPLSGRVFHPLRLDVDNAATYAEETEWDAVSQPSATSNEITPDVLAHRLAKRWSGGDTHAYATTLASLMTHYNFLRHVYLPVSEKGRKTAIEQLCGKWRVPIRKDAKVSTRSLYDFQVMDLILKVYPGFTRKEALLELKPKTAFASGSNDAASSESVSLQDLAVPPSLERKL